MGNRCGSATGKLHKAERLQERQSRQRQRAGGLEPVETLLWAQKKEAEAQEISIVVIGAHSCAVHGELGVVPAVTRTTIDSHLT